MLTVPFTVYANVVPERGYGDRRTYTHAIEKIADYIKNDIEDYLDANPTHKFTISDNRPLVVPQFAQFSSRVTIEGFDTIDEPTFQPATKVAVDAPSTDPVADNYEGEPGKVIEGYMGTKWLHPHSQQLDPRVSSYMQILKQRLEAASSYLDDIVRIDYMNISFGQGGHSFL